MAWRRDVVTNSLPEDGEPGPLGTHFVTPTGEQSKPEGICFILQILDSCEPQTACQMLNPSALVSLNPWRPSHKRACIRPASVRKSDTPCNS